MLSVVLPAYNEEKMIKKAAGTIGNILKNEEIDYEIVFVDDGSKDGTWREIESAGKEDEHVNGVRFSRNFGKESAMMAGLENADGDCVVVMDCDLQHPPETIVEMYRLWQQGYEVVEGVKRTRGRESVFHKMSAGLFYRMISKAVKIDMSHASDFKLLDRRAVEALLEMPERNAFFRALSSWIGFRSISVEFDVRDREIGESKWSTKSLIRYAISNIVSFSSAPMTVVTITGILGLLFAVILGIQTLVNYFSGHAVEGFTTVILIILIMGSLILMGLGIIGYYIAKIYEEVKCRPRYIISKKTGKHMTWEKRR
ncbi:glycosyltransferase family 2 protein [Eubacterium sp. MSJ-33]|uniref:glycosyltransferase family 2 protein n=1 Tax=Eubacterium sp. MSJ-33 TaxID=2841528 RepID=UPI001C78AD1D|nr:glycosyltransferase family 2 protein [Eubacterium sp. MSJ-33]QWT54131.1 glycosyltransferase family 2 protein [Eubacterium sp. MSJ-33]